MTEVALPTSTAGPPEVLPTSKSEPPEPRAGESLTRRVARSVLSRTTARLGIAWIGGLLLCAVFAPFLCNTHPLLMMSGGHWSSPLVQRNGANTAHRSSTPIHA